MSSGMSIEISDSALEAAVSAAKKEAGGGLQTLTRWEMRAAIAAALPLIVGEPVAWRVGNGGDVWMFRRKPNNGWRCEETLYAIKQGASREG